MHLLQIFYWYSNIPFSKCCPLRICHTYQALNQSDHKNSISFKVGNCQKQLHNPNALRSRFQNFWQLNNCKNPDFTIFPLWKRISCLYTVESECFLSSSPWNHHFFPHQQDVAIKWKVELNQQNMCHFSLHTYISLLSSLMKFWFSCFKKLYQLFSSFLSHDFTSKFYLTDVYSIHICCSQITVQTYRRVCIIKYIIVGRLKFNIYRSYPWPSRTRAAQCGPRASSFHSTWKLVKKTESQFHARPTSWIDVGS